MLDELLGFGAGDEGGRTANNVSEVVEVPRADQVPASKRERPKERESEREREREREKVRVGNKG